MAAFIHSTNRCRGPICLALCWALKIETELKENKSKALTLMELTFQCGRDSQETYMVCHIVMSVMKKNKTEKKIGMGSSYYKVKDGL